MSADVCAQATGQNRIRLGFKEQINATDAIGRSQHDLTTRLAVRPRQHIRAWLRLITDEVSPVHAPLEFAQILASGDHLLPGVAAFGEVHPVHRFVIDHLWHEALGGGRNDSGDAAQHLGTPPGRRIDCGQAIGQR